MTASLVSWIGNADINGGTEELSVELIRADINDLPDTSIPVKRELRTVHELRGIMKYRKKGITVGEGTASTGTKDGNIEDFDYPIYLSGDAEALQYRRRLKDILDEMVKDNPILQKVYNDEPYHTLR